MKFAPFTIVFAACLVMPLAAHAALGGNIASIETDRVQMKATSRVARTENAFTVHELVMNSGTTVREYVAKDGTIFGVAWRGPAIPNLQQLLGQYFSALNDSAAVKRNGHAQLQVHQDDLVVHASGHMRAFAGHAYLSSKLPQGVQATDIQ
ncbi:MAG TPA: DUF2844 domain-containing protein [Burkholderiaceae bacterium]|jgi:hypothetical protein